MEPSKVFWVVCITLFLVVGINAAIFVWVSGKNTVGQIELLRRAAHRARQPWKSEEEALKELSQAVAHLKEKEGGVSSDENVKGDP